MAVSPRNSKAPERKKTAVLAMTAVAKMKSQQANVLLLNELFHRRHSTSTHLSNQRQQQHNQRQPANQRELDEARRNAASLQEELTATRGMLKRGEGAAKRAETSACTAPRHASSTPPAS